MSTFLLEIVTPDRLVFAEDVEMVSVPSAMGQLGILPRHVPLFSQLVEGELKIVKDGKESFLSIGGGFLEVAGKKTTILITRVVNQDELNEEEILRAKKEAEEALKQKPTGEVRIAAEAAFRRSLIDLKVLRRQRHFSVTTSAS